MGGNCEYSEYAATAYKGWSSRLGSGWGITIPVRNHFVKDVTQGLGLVFDLHVDRKIILKRMLQK
jgi:hypothetical protein